MDIFYNGHRLWCLFDAEKFDVIIGSRGVRYIFLFALLCGRAYGWKKLKLSHGNLKCNLYLLFCNVIPLVRLFVGEKTSQSEQAVKQSVFTGMNKSSKILFKQNHIVWIVPNYKIHIINQLNEIMFLHEFLQE